MFTNKRKGFTLVELVVVIAVIAILAAIMVPTFSSVINSANVSAAEQEAHNLYIGILTEYKGTFEDYCGDFETEEGVEATDNIIKGDTSSATFSDYVSDIEGKIIINAEGAYIEYTTSKSFKVTIKATGIEVVKADKD